MVGQPFAASMAFCVVITLFVSLGCGMALVDILGVRVSGWLAWWIYRGAYLLKLVGMKN